MAMADAMARVRNSSAETWRRRLADARTAAQNDYAARGVGNSSIHVYGIRDIDFAEAQARIDEMATAARDVARLRQIEPDIDSELAAFARHAREATSELAESWVRIRAQRGMQEDLSDGQAVKRQHQLLAEYIDRSAAVVRTAIDEGLPMTPRRAGWTPGPPRPLLQANPMGSSRWRPSPARRRRTPFHCRPRTLRRPDFCRR